MKNFLYRVLFFTPTRVVIMFLLTLFFNAVYVFIIHGIVWIFGGDFINLLFTNNWVLTIWLLTFGVGFATFSTAMTGIILEHYRESYNRFKLKR